MKRLLFIIFAAIFSTTIMAQNTRIVKGMVMDVDESPLSGVTIKGIHSDAETKSKGNGLFEIKVSPYTKYIEASLKGYLTAKAEIDGSYIVFKLKIDKDFAKKEAAAKEEAKRIADREAAAKAKAEEEARLAAEREAIAKAKAEKEARLAAEREAIAKANAEKEARLAAEREAIAKANAEKEARLAAEREAKRTTASKEDAIKETAVEETNHQITNIVKQGVDLGLPSGLKWATCNINASCPEEDGSFFAWGETTDKERYDDSNCKTFNKKIETISGNKRYDIASICWGDGWHIPTLKDFKELIDHCIWTWVQLNGVNGYKVTGKNGNSIFLPANGYYNGAELYEKGSAGYYWSASPDKNFTQIAYYLYFGNDYYNTAWNTRSIGRCIRPVTK